MAENCFRFLNIKSWYEFDRLTLKQLRIMSKAFKLRQVDKEFETYRQAWVNREVKAEKRIGKSSKLVYDKFEKFYDYNERIREVEENKTSENKNSSNSLIKRFSEFQKLKKGEK